MGVVVFGSVRSCGVTTLAAALAATWPAGRRVVLVEANPAGGTLAAASGWPAEPSLVSLAAAARRGLDAELAWGHCQALPGGVPVLAGPASADQARSALGMLGGFLGRLGELDADVLVDGGRLDLGSPMMALLESASRVVLAVRPRLADLHALATWIEAHPLGGGRAGLVVVGGGPYPDGEIADTFGVEVLARLPWDPDAAESLVSVPASARELRMAPLVRTARSLADRLAAELAGTAPLGEAASPAVTGRSSVGLRSRVLRAWRPDSLARSMNGTAPESPHEVTQ
jgi:MinD-like ATPase involved in chromosome partitioning or flagellar assembly